MLKRAAAAAAAIIWAAWWLRRTHVVVTVEGHSMAPTLQPGARVLIRRGTDRLQRGRIVVVTCPDGETGWRGLPPAPRDLKSTEWYIKRAVALPGDAMPGEDGPTGATVPAGHLAVVGDGMYSSDSRQHGPCPADQVLGTVVRVLGKG